MELAKFRSLRKGNIPGDRADLSEGKGKVIMADTAKNNIKNTEDKKISGKERVLSAFQHREGDRVPIYEQAFASDVASEILGRKVYTGSTSLFYEEAKAWMQGEDAHKEFEEHIWEDLIAITRYFEFDCIAMPWRMREKPSKRMDEYSFLYGDQDGENWAVYRFDPDSQTCGVVDSWENHLQPEDIPKIVEKMQDDHANHEPLTEASFRGRRRLLEAFGEELMVLGGGGLSIPCTPAWLEAILLYPEAIARLLDIQVANSLESIKVLAKMGIKIIWGGGDMASKKGPLYSPKTFHQFILPRLKKITRLCDQLGIYYLFRSDGNLWPVAEDLFKESGIHGYGEIEGDAGMDLGRLKKEYGYLTFWGNVSCDILRRGTKEDVIKEAKSCIDKAAKKGGYIFGSSNAILSGTPAENVIAVYETAREYGKY